MQLGKKLTELAPGRLKKVLLAPGGTVVLETVRNTAVYVPTAEYYRRLLEICHKWGALLILDEIPIGLGRTGRMFAFENFGIEPDMVVIGKGLGGAVFPMAALIARDDFDLSPETSLGHYTHEKSPLGCTAALAVLEYMEENRLLEHARAMGSYFMTKLFSLKEKYSAVIGDVRGFGLMFAVELVKDTVTKEKAEDLAERVMYIGLEKGISFKVSQGNILTLAPPLIISKGELDQAAAILDESIGEGLKG